jgi:hypothetical protein
LEVPVGRRTVTILLEIIGGLILIIAVAVALLAFRLSSGPMELGIFRDDVEDALTRARDGRPVSLGEVFLEWSPDDRRVVVTANTLQLKTMEGDLSAEADRAEIILSASSLITGEFEVLQLHMQDGWLNIDQMSPSQWQIAGDPLPPIPQGTLPETPKEWLARANEVLPILITGVEGARERFTTESLTYANFELRLRGPEQQPLFKITNSKGEIKRQDSGLSLSVSGSGVGEGLPAGLAVDIATSGEGERIAAELGIADWPIAELAERFGVDDAGISGLQSDIQLSISGDKTNGLDEFVFATQSGEGHLPFQGRRLNLADLTATSTYKADTDQLVLDMASSSAGPLSGGFILTLEDVLNAKDLRDFTLTSDALTLDMTPTFAAPFKWSGLSLAGAANPEERHLVLKKATLKVPDGAISIKADIKQVQDRKTGEPPIIGTLTATSSGEISKQDILAHWPVNEGKGARRFIEQRILNAVVKDVEANIQVARDSFEEGGIADEAVDVTFQVENGTVAFLSDVPPVEAANGRAKLTGNTFKILVDSGKYVDWDLTDGVVDFPAFRPKGEDFRIFAKGRGPAKSLMKVLTESRLKVDFDTERLEGEADLTFEMFRPARDNVDQKDVRWSGVGAIENAGLKNAALGFDMTSATTKLNFDKTGVTVTGFGDLGPVPVQFTWRDGFSDGNQPTDLSASAVVTPDLLNSFGLLGRAYLSGEIPVEMQAKIDQKGLSSAALSLDLDSSRVDVSELGWVKPKGEPAKASVNFSVQENSRSGNLIFSSEDARLDMDLVVGTNLKLISAIVNSAMLKDTADVSGAVARGADDGLQLSLSGEYLDISGAMPGLGAMGGGPKKSTPFSLEANVERLRLSETLLLTDASIGVISAETGLEKLTVIGETGGNSKFDARYEAGGSGAPAISIVGGDAGFLAASFFGLDFLEGGDLDMKGTLAFNRAPARLNINIQGARLRDAPFLTQILSLASLRGLADTLGGEGVLFSNIEVPLTISEGRYIVTGGKAQGPALGLTSNGYINSKTGAIEFDGVLVPSFGLNSALGGIPIIGDLVVGRDGEGVFSLTYGVNGSLEKANVSVNPLSALAPGVIRRIFENPSDTTIPEAKPRAPDVPIPSELPPIPEEEF